MDVTSYLLGKKSSGGGGEAIILTPSNIKFENQTASTLDLSNIKLSNLSSTNLSNMFANSKQLTNITSISNWDTAKITSFSGIFTGCNALTSLNLSGWNFEKTITITYMFQSCNSLANLMFGYNLGKGYLTTANANYNNYKLDLHWSPLTHDSLMSVINNLYDIATAGVQPQQLVLGSTNLAKLSQAEIDIATNKGWVVS